ncbi:TPA: hypothetical protein DCE37_22140 [Candidatus Latescibacteria bacterium]|nr:hypothetical protein [Candidatus Latescibacterota bacterium]
MHRNAHSADQYTECGNRIRRDRSVYGRAFFLRPSVDSRVQPRRGRDLGSRIEPYRRPTHPARTRGRGNCIRQCRTGRGRQFGWKRGIGTSSRVVSITGHDSTLSVLVQANFGDTLTIDGLQLADLEPEGHKEADGASVMIIFATNLPLSGSELDRVAKRATFGLARRGRGAATAAETM